MLDELGDVLFQVYFLALLLEERGKGDLGAVADHCREKLIRRHPHVFGERAARDRRRRGAQLAGDQARAGAGRRRRSGTSRDASVHDLREEGAEAGEFRRARVERSRATIPGDRLLAAVTRSGGGRGGPRAQPAGGGRQVPRPGGGGRLSDIETVHARQILDSRGNPTVEVDVVARLRRRRAARRCPPARPPASSRRWSCATAAPPGPARACPGRWTT